MSFSGTFCPVARGRRRRRGERHRDRKGSGEEKGKEVETRVSRRATPI